MTWSIIVMLREDGTLVMPGSTLGRQRRGSAERIKGEATDFEPVGTHIECTDPRKFDRFKGEHQGR